MPAELGPNAVPGPNPYAEGDNYLMPIQPAVADLLFSKVGYVKKLFDEANAQEDTAKLIKFACWENPHFSSMVLSELLVQIAFSYAYELRPHLDLLLHTLLIEDSWQQLRIVNALKGEFRV